MQADARFQVDVRAEKLKRALWNKRGKVYLDKIKSS